MEIQDLECYKYPCITPVLETDLVFEKWDNVPHDIIHGVNVPGIETIGCSRRGRSSVKRDNPPTALVTVSSKSKGSWNSTRDLIVNILDRHELPTVAVEIMKDEIRRGPHKSTDVYGRPSLEREILQGPGLIGQSIAPHPSKMTSGSVGGFVKLQFSDGHWREFALTSFRCVFPMGDDEIEPQYFEGKG